MSKEDVIRRKFHGFSDEQWEELKDIFPYNEIPAIIDEIMKPEVHSPEELENIELALLDAIWTMRWTENKQAMYAVLNTEEAYKIAKDIFIELDKIGYEIRKKNE